MNKIYYKITVFVAAVVALLHVGANKQEDTELSTDDFSWNDLNITPRVYANVEDDSPSEPDPDLSATAPTLPPTVRPPTRPPSPPSPGPRPSGGGTSSGGSGSTSEDSQSGGSGTTSAGSGGVGCFVSGTLIDVPNGYKEIQDIQVGDQVLSFDEHTREVSIQVVLNIFKHDDTAEEILCINDSLRVTPGHRFLTVNGWVMAGDLSKGDQVYCDSEQTITIESVVSTGKSCDKDNPVFNFEVTNNHTYVAGGMWVHNAKAAGAMCGCGE